MGNNIIYVQFGILLIVVYFFMIRIPQNRIKKEKEFQAAMKVGEKIVTTSGIHGKISEMGDKTVVIETMSGKLKIERSAISQELTLALNAAK